MPASQPVFIDGQWCPSDSVSTFQSLNPVTGEMLPELFPVSRWSDVDRALQSATEAYWELKGMPVSVVADFLEAYAAGMESAKDSLVAIAATESALPASPRLADVEFPRTVNQLRLAATAARSGSWSLPTIDTAARIRSCYQAIGPICVFGPNNFPFAFNSVSGGDFAAAIAAGNPVIGKANSSHPATTKRLMEVAGQAMKNSGAPRGLVQLIYRTDHADGERLVSEPRVGATGYTGARHAGLALKSAADRAGKPIYLELSSINPVLILPGALNERAAAIVDEYVTSGLMGAGQFCTNPGLVILIDNPTSRQFVQTIAERYAAATPGTLLSKGVKTSLEKGIDTLVKNGAELLVGGKPVEGVRCAMSNTVMQTSGSNFIANAEALQTEVFGNASLCVLCSDTAQAEQVLRCLEGNLTGCIYSDTKGSDDATYGNLSAILETKVGRILNDKMPTGVAVSPAMNHGGPYPATGHPGFTAVGIPASMIRFAKLTSFDNVRQARLPWVLKDAAPSATTWRCVDGKWMVGSLPSAT